MRKRLPALYSIPFTILISFCLSTACAQCLSTSWHNASTFTTDNSTGVYDFANSSNAQVSDNVRASASSLISILSGNTYYLKATGFNFTIPSYASICGITVEVESRATGLLLTAAVRDNDVKIIKGGSILGNNHALGGDWGSSDTYRSYGGANDLWSEAFLPSDVNAADFGVAFSARIIALVAALPTADIDHIRMKIDYNPVLPVSLEYFTAARKGNLVNLEWKTGEEEDQAVISLQRSDDKITWKDLQRINLHGYTGNNIYKHTDTLSANESCQYRLQTILPSGQVTYSDIRYIAPVFLKRPVVYPNPASDYVVVNLNEAGIHDRWGRRLTLPVISNGNSSTFFINSLPAGLYFITNGLETLKFIKR